MLKAEIMETIYRITLPYACYGIISRNNIIVLAPPIASWTIGKNISDFIKWVELKGEITERIMD